MTSPIFQIALAQAPIRESRIERGWGNLFRRRLVTKVGHARGWVGRNKRAKMKKTGEIWWKQEEREERIGNEKIEKHGIKVEKKKKK